MFIPKSIRISESTTSLLDSFDYALGQSQKMNGVMDGYVSFRWLVFALSVYEYNQKHAIASSDKLRQLYNGVVSIIPDNL